jgi:hypothetical protein
MVVLIAVIPSVVVDIFLVASAILLVVSFRFRKLHGQRRSCKAQTSLSGGGGFLSLQYGLPNCGSGFGGRRTLGVGVG